MKKITCISRVILNEVKNLNTSTSAFQILRFAQDDTSKLMQLIFYALPITEKGKNPLEPSSILQATALNRHSTVLNDESTILFRKTASWF